MSAPPTRLTLDTVSVAARQRDFVHGLVARSPLQVTRERLTHDVGSDAPRGRSEGLAFAVPDRRRSRLAGLREHVLPWLSPKHAQSQRRHDPEPGSLPAVPDPSSQGRTTSASASDSRAQRKVTDRTSPLASDLQVPPTRSPNHGRSGRGRALADDVRLPRAISGRIGRETTSPSSATRAERKPLIGSRERSPRTFDERVEKPAHPERVKVEQRFGVDLSDVRVHRGTESADLVRRLRAQAFTTAGGLHVPLEAGPLERGPGRALLAHELVHVAQQRRLAPDVPTEASAQGQSLETEAQVLAPTPGRRRDWQDVLDPISNAGGHAEKATDLAHLRRLVGPPGDDAGNEPTSAVSILPDMRVPRGLQRAPEAEQSAEATSEASLDDVLYRLYDAFSTRLRAELLVDRERAGWLNDR